MVAFSEYFIELIKRADSDLEEIARKRKERELNSNPKA
jgi:hypothetical protein